MPTTSAQDAPAWTFQTSHTRALVHIAQNPDARLRDIVAELATAGYLTRRRVGRRNTHTVAIERPLHAAPIDGLSLGALLRGLGCGPVGAGPVGDTREHDDE